MKFCQKHWDMLRDAIKERGLWPLVARNGAEAAERTKQELEGEATDATYDPLLSCHWMISEQALKEGGLYLLQGAFCPVCEAMKNTPTGGIGEYQNEDEVENDWINGPADAVLEYVKESDVMISMLGWDKLDA